MQIQKSTLLLLPLFLFLVILSCKPAVTKEEIPVETKPKETTSFPSLGNEQITQLYAAAQKLDMIFYDLPISVNQDDAASAKNSVLYISPAPATLNNSCKALGRMSWIADGVIIKEADIYADSLCKYFIFMENNAPVAANVMSESGVKFFESVMSQVQQRQ